MAKLGYTFYPKDWRSSMNVSQLTLQEKGFYRELIDECFIQSSSKILINCKTFTRINQLNVRSFARLLAKLHESLLIVCPNFDQTLTEVEILIPSVSHRLGVIKDASNGGKAKALNTQKSSAKENIKEKENINIDIRKLKFADTLKPFVEKYGKEMIRAFFDYWTEPNKSNTKFRMELEKTWGLEKRLTTWNNNESNFKSKNKSTNNHDTDGIL